MPRLAQTARLLCALLVLSLPMLLMGCGSTPRSGASGMPLGTPVARAAVKERLLGFVGDSVTVGLGSTSPAATYPALVAAAAGARSIEVATIGWQTYHALAALQAQPRALVGAQAVVVELGTNDAGSHAVYTFDQWQGQYVRLLAAVRAQAPRARLVCLTPWRSLHDLGKDGVPVTEYAVWITAQCIRANGQVVDLTPIYDTPGTHWAVDGFHPNDDGYARIAAAVEQALGTVVTR